MIHILFGASASGSLKYALRETGLNKREKIISFWDIFSTGPVWQLHEENGVKSRFEWMKKCMNDEFGEYPDYTGSFNKTFLQINSIPDGEHVTIWASDSAHEQTGLRFVVYLLKERNIDMTVINTTEEYDKLFRMKKVKYTLLHTGEIPPEKLQHIFEHGSGKFLTDHGREGYEKEWLSLAETRETLRIWRNGRIQSVPEDYYDEVIIKKAKKLHGKQKTKDFMKSARLIGEVLGHLDQYVGDTLLEYRLKRLIESGVFEFEGILEAMRFYSVRLKS
ncbi:DUF1835 domain-containing protein [Cytobacillus gottheilii]|uniref:DUF1835 domain-containing protein n=1 Tax=Cytobacillus gottheilii TaxID=859144 RepID=UPI0009BA85F4|nr:DUF1835 domain-containing protein [Cytobacillus gottheilii]